MYVCMHMFACMYVCMYRERARARAYRVATPAVQEREIITLMTLMCSKRDLISQ
jgi:hypothetical protein